MFCWHKWKNPDFEHRTQTCLKCNIVRIFKCSHKWEKLDTKVHEISSWRTSHIGETFIAITGERFTYIQKCKWCGEIRDKQVIIKC